MTHNETPDTSPRPRRGVSIVEILVAITTLAIVLTFAARASFAVNAYDRTNNVKAKTAMAMQQQMNYLGAMSYASLTDPYVLPNSKDFTTGDFSYTRRLSVNQNGQATRITITIVPQTGVPSDTIQRETLTLMRTVSPCGTVLFTC
jgi:Tfp pilus assembly protein PilE